jgi:hypothetical protein
MLSTQEVPGNKMPHPDDPAYDALVAELPPRIIRTQEQLDATWKRINDLLAQDTLSAAAEDYLALLSNLVADWEDEHEPTRSPKHDTEAT